jgi:hypothetical protein
MTRAFDRQQLNHFPSSYFELQEKKLQAHKIVMAASSKFFCAQLCRNNILVPVILKLEDFGLDLDFDAVQVH